MKANLLRMDYSTGKMEEIKPAILEVGKKVIGVLGYGGSESGTFICASEPDSRNCQELLEIGGKHRVCKWVVGQNDKPYSKKFGIGFYWDDSTDELMSIDDIEKLRKQCAIQALWDGRKMKNIEIAHKLKKDKLRKEYGSFLNEVSGKSYKEGADNLKILLKRNFPGIRFYFSSKHSYLRIKWQDGPSEKQVKELASLFIDMRFDSYTDYHESFATAFTDLYGGIGYRPECDRSYSDKAIYEAWVAFHAEHPEANGEREGEFMPEHSSAFTRRFEPTYIKHGIEYYLSNKNLMPEKTKEKVTDKTAIEIVDYSEKALAVVGNTKQFADKLRALGGKFNSHLKCGAGWIFSKRKETEIRALFSL